MKAEASTAVTKKKKSRKFFKKPTKMEVFTFFLITIAIVAVLWPFCTKRIEGGYVGVYYSTFFGGTQTSKVLNEGLHFVLPWDAIIPYDTRVQSQAYQIKALAKGGLSVDVELTAVYYINRDEAGMLHKTIGPEYTTKLINPAVLSSVRSIVGKLTQTELYDADILKIQDDALKEISSIFAGQPLTVKSVLIRQIAFPQSVSAAINNKFVAEQNVLEERYRVLEAVEDYKQTYVDAEATRFEQALISEGMTEAYLRYLGIEATTELSESDNAKLVIIGDKDGLPLILNPETLTETDGDTDGITVDEYRVGEGEQTRPDQFQENYDRVLGMLEALTGITDDVSEKFADAPYDIDTTIPQQGQVSINEETE
ncbi:MAG: prohibitin family protein [Ruminococcus sp.]|nr:prohibitin family protein [Ruminococcus sp.]